VIRGIALVTYPNLAPHLAAVFALTTALAGFIGGILRDFQTPVTPDVVRWPGG
jgi:hypothetical protein